MRTETKMIASTKSPRGAVIYTSGPWSCNPMLTLTQYAAREGITKQAAHLRVPYLNPKPKVTRLRTKSGRTVARILIDPQAVYTPGKPGPKGPRRDYRP